MTGGTADVVRCCTWWWFVHRFDLDGSVPRHTTVALLPLRVCSPFPPNAHFNPPPPPPQELAGLFDVVERARREPPETFPQPLRALAGSLQVTTNALAWRCVARVKGAAPRLATQLPYDCRYFLVVQGGGRSLCDTSSLAQPATSSPKLTPPPNPPTPNTQTHATNAARRAPAAAAVGRHGDGRRRARGRVARWRAGRRPHAALGRARRRCLGRRAGPLGGRVGVLPARARPRARRVVARALRSCFFFIICLSYGGGGVRPHRRMLRLEPWHALMWPEPWHALMWPAPPFFAFLFFVAFVGAFFFVSRLHVACSRRRAQRDRLSV